MRCMFTSNDFLLSNWQKKCTWRYSKRYVYKRTWAAWKLVTIYYRDTWPGACGQYLHPWYCAWPVFVSNSETKFQCCKLLRLRPVVTNLCSGLGHILGNSTVSLVPDFLLSLPLPPLTGAGLTDWTVTSAPTFSALNSSTGSIGGGGCLCAWGLNEALQTTAFPTVSSSLNGEECLPYPHPVIKMFVCQPTGRRRL